MLRMKSFTWGIKFLMATAGASVALLMLTVTALLVFAGPEYVDLAFHWSVLFVHELAALLICWRFLDRGPATEAAEQS